MAVPETEAPIGVRVRALQTGEVRMRPAHLEPPGPSRLERTVFGRRLAVLRDRDWTVPMPMLTFLIDHPEGTFLFDTGELSPESALTAAGNRRVLERVIRRVHPFLNRALDVDVKPADEIGPQLAALGIDPARDLAGVVISHLHNDHADGLSQVAGAPVLVSRANYEASRGFGGLNHGALPHRWPNGFDPQLIDLRPGDGPFEASHPLTSDGRLMLVSTPGHMPGHVSLVVRGDDATYLLTGDATYSQEALLAGRVDRVAEDLVAARHSLRALDIFARGESAVVLPAHDLRSVERLELREPYPPR
jgi:N-acyl homoserine lactone hydrolase